VATSCNIITVHGNHYHLRFITVDGADETDILSFLTCSSPAYLEPLVNKKKQAGLNVNYWRDRAEGMRVIAELMRDEQSKKLMFGIAEEYDRMAESAERRFANEVQRPCRDPA
jgi:hypothetical protein